MKTISTQSKAIETYLAEQGFAALAHSIRTSKTTGRKAAKFLLEENSHLLRNNQYDTLTTLAGL
jgi:hypothetical protein